MWILDGDPVIITFLLRDRRLLHPDELVQNKRLLDPNKLGSGGDKLRLLSPDVLGFSLGFDFDIVVVVGCLCGRVLGISGDKGQALG